MVSFLIISKLLKFFSILKSDDSSLSLRSSFTTDCLDSLINLTLLITTNMLKLDHLTLLLWLFLNLMFKQRIWSFGKNMNIHTIGIFIDFKKVLVLKVLNMRSLVTIKLNSYGVCGIPLTWPTSYLNDRQQYVMIHDHISSTNKVVWGIIPRVPFLVLSFFSFTCSQIFFSLLSILQSFSLLVIQTFLCHKHMLLYGKELLIKAFFRFHPDFML